jgi:hypothetical protein
MWEEEYENYIREIGVANVQSDVEHNLIVKRIEARLEDAMEELKKIKLIIVINNVVMIVVVIVMMHK